MNTRLMIGLICFSALAAYIGRTQISPLTKDLELRPVNSSTLVSSPAKPQRVLESGVARATKPRAESAVQPVARRHLTPDQMIQDVLEFETHAMTLTSSSPAGVELRLQSIADALQPAALHELESTVLSSRENGDKRFLALYLISKSTRTEAKNWLWNFSRSPLPVTRSQLGHANPQVRFESVLREYAKEYAKKTPKRNRSERKSVTKAKPAEAAPADCFDANLAQTYISQFQMTGQYDFSNLCSWPERGRQVLDAIHWISTVRFDDSLKLHPLDAGIVNVPYYDYLKSHITKIQNGGCSSDDYIVACIKGTIPTMHLQSQFFDSKTPFLMRASTLIHEAKHTEGFRHVNCTSGPLAGTSGGCDQRFKDRGSYAVEIEFYVRVAQRGSQIHPAVRALARATAISTMEENFNEAPSIPVQALAFSAKPDGHLSIYDGKQITEFPKLIALHSKLIAASTGVAVLPFNRTKDAWLFDPYTGEEFPAEHVGNAIGGTLRSYNALYSGDRYLFIDILNRRDLQSRLHEDRVEFSLQPQRQGDEVQFRSLSTEGYRITGFAASDFCWRPRLFFGNPKPYPVQLMNDQGELYQVVDLYSENPSLKKMDCSLPREVRSVVSFKGLYLGLTEEGRILSLTRDGDLASPVKALENVRALEMTPFTYHLDLKSTL